MVQEMDANATMWPDNPQTAHRFEVSVLGGKLVDVSVLYRQLTRGWVGISGYSLPELHLLRLDGSLTRKKSWTVLVSC